MAEGSAGTVWAISSFGAFALAWLMINRIMVQDYYFEALYFFLHFQYNGWFLFACFGLLFSWLYRKGVLSSVVAGKKLFIIMAITVAPTYFLSILWLKLPVAIRVIAGIPGTLQLLVLIYFIKLFTVVKKHIPHVFFKSAQYLWIMASVAFILKIILQMLSVIPNLSHFAFGFRPIVIGYLHFIIHRNYQLFYFRLCQRSFKAGASASKWRGNYSFCNWIPGAGNHIDDAGS